MYMPSGLQLDITETFDETLPIFLIRLPTVRIPLLLLRKF